MIEKEMTEDLKNKALDLIKDMNWNFEELRDLLERTEHTASILHLEEQISDLRNRIMNSN